jgi:uncharacterized protein YxjI
MAAGGYQRTCRQCQRAWLVPAQIAEERPSLGASTSQAIAQIGASFDQQLALRAHYQRLAAAARCPQCGATSFTQERVAEVPGEPPAPADAPPAAPPMPDGQGRTYVLNQALVSLTGDAWIEDGSGNRAFAVDGSLLSLRATHVLKDLSGRPLYKISRPLAPHLHKTIGITRGGQAVATVEKALFNLAGDKFKITIAGGPVFTVRGDWMNREFQVADQAGRLVMSASRAWFTIHNGYGIQISPGYEVALGLAVAIALERVEDAERGGSSPIHDLLGDISPF